MLLDTEEDEKLLKSKYAVKKTEQLSFETIETVEVQVVRQILRVDKLSMESEADTQFAKMFVEQLGRDNAKPVDVPLGFDPNHFGYGRESHKAIKEELDERAKYKICSTDRVDLDTVVKILGKKDVKNLAKTMQTPKEGDVQRVQLCERQKMPKMMKCYGDSDHAGDAEWRRSNISQMSGRSAIGMGIQALLHDWSITKKFRVMTDDSSRKAFASKRGLDKMQNIQIRFLYPQVQRLIQERLVVKHFVSDKVSIFTSTLHNPADVHTKQLSAERMHKHSCQWWQAAIRGKMAGGRDKTAKWMKDDGGAAASE